MQAAGLDFSEKKTRGALRSHRARWLVSFVVVVERGNENKSSGEALKGTRKARYPERMGPRPDGVGLPARVDGKSRAQAVVS